MGKYAERVYSMQSEVTKLKVLTDPLISPTIIAFAGGAPAKEAYPFDQVREICDEIFRPGEKGYAAMAYGSTLGYLPLREAVRDYLLKPIGLDVEAKNIMITAGGIQPLNFMCQLYLNPGDYILVETPTFVHANMIFKMFGAKFAPCKTDEDGLDIRDVEEKIKKYHPAFIYVMPTFENPTGITMSQDKRIKLAELANKYDVMVLEDDPYREIRYSGEEMIPIKAYDEKDNVIFCGSFSKIFAPGSRLGFMVASDDQLEKLGNIKLGTDTCTNGFTQVICGEFFKRGYYPAHRQHLKNLYTSRRDAMTETIDNFFPKGTKRTSPDGGYYVWVELPQELDSGALSKELETDYSICYGNGSIFFSEGCPEGAGSNTIRMNFTGQTEESIRENVKKIGEFFTKKYDELKK